MHNDDCLKAYAEGFMAKCAAVGVDPATLVKAAARGDMLAKLLTNGVRYVPDDAADVMTAMRKLSPAALSPAGKRLAYARAHSQFSANVGRNAATQGIVTAPSRNIPLSATKANRRFMDAVRWLKLNIRSPQTTHEAVDASKAVLAKLTAAGQPVSV